ncbi:MAG: HalOD1 output domain-containing protein [Haloferacaceae archaeon]|jgi:hypothetical protein
MVSDGDDTPVAEVTTADEFADAVRAAVRSAVENDVDVRGSWRAEGVADGGYDVEVVAVAPGGRADDRSPAAAVAETVAAREGVAKTALPPVADAVDPDALDAVVDGDDDRRRLSFEYCGYPVTVHADGSVSLGE